METNTRKLTIVVPIYNVETYLRQCLDSLLNQSVQDFKVIMVDDGSKDNSGKIAQEYAQTYPEQFYYVYQENAGLGAARNTGMKYCDTPFIEFLDSDDWLLPRTVELVLRRLDKESEIPDIIFMTPVVYDMATCKFSEWSDNEALRHIFDGKLTTNPQQTPDMLSLEASVNRCVWNRAFLEKHAFSFPEGVKWEDVAPHFYIFYWARRCIMVENSGFCYRVNSGNQITSSSDEGRLDIIPVFSKALLYAFENNWSKSEVAHILRMFVDFAVWSMTVTKKEVYGRLVKQIHMLVKIIPASYIKTFIKQFHPSKTEIILLHLLRSPFYGILSNYHREELGARMIQRLTSLARRR